ncbi:MAG: hypothetical protein AAGB05_13230 [Pseudomonadota bacterium]
MKKTVLLLAALACQSVSAQPSAPDYFIEGAALLRVASHMASQCADVQVDVGTDESLRMGVYEMLDTEGWDVRDPRLHSERARDAVLATAEARYAALGLETPLVAAQVCPVARAQAEAGTVLGRLFKVDPP